MSAAGIRRTTRRLGGEAGVTLVEVMVGMVIMSVVMAMFMSSMIQMFRTANKTEAVSAAQSQIGIAFQRLDKEIRYAEGISVPMSDSTGWYVEYVTTTTGTAICTQLWLDAASGQLKQRNWVHGASYASITGVPLASRVSANPTPFTTSNPAPFTVSDPDSTFGFQRLRVALTATSGSDKAESRKDVDVTFTAINTSLDTSSATVCTEGRPIPW
jgi:prepilin-type N-terminal cleavage/methylation domain-containing protein